MAQYQETPPDIYQGRKSDQQLYLHEKIICKPIQELVHRNSEKNISILGYSCEEGVKRNHGRTGTDQGPDAIRKQLGKLPNHLMDGTIIWDEGTINCNDFNLENTQAKLTEKISEILANKSFPIILGGGHDIAYGTYNGLRNHLGNAKTIGIINFDAHFDLRSDENGSNSGTPFYQIAQDCKGSNTPFHYLCLGIRNDANDRNLFETAKELEVKYILRDTFRIEFHNEINAWINAFIQNVDAVYVTIDLDGFSSAYAPGVSAPSPMGFTPDVVLESLKTITGSGKLCALDIAEMNPDFDVDYQTARLAASLVHYVLHSV
ncbi:formimidoylglutamase [Maribacter aestuarii]|uniref:formimidoylglutamase n=1 Tax=Maribacter aestuarii TaxID=1130723 RepID=UPI00248C2188|nr:formimidoylglutamase [Maribacter aestuarii]